MTSEIQSLPTSTTSSADVAVLGAGAVGVNAALFLARLGFQVVLLDAAATILQGAPLVSFINHGDGFEYYKPGHRRTGEYCIDGSFTKALLYPIDLFATSTCNAANPIRFFVSRGSVERGTLTYGDFLLNVGAMQRHFENQYARVQAALGLSDDGMGLRFLRTPAQFARELQKRDYADVQDVVGGCFGSSFGINMAHYYAYLSAALRALRVPFYGGAEPISIERHGYRYDVQTNALTIRVQHVLLAAGHQNPTLISRIRGATITSQPIGTYYLNAMSLVRLPATRDETAQARAKKINFTLQQEHGGMFACVVAPTELTDGVAAVYWPTTAGSQLRSHTVRDDVLHGPPPEWQELISAGLPSDDPHVTDTLRRTRMLYPVLADAEVYRTVCRPVFNAATTDSDYGKDRRVREIPGSQSAVVSDGSISAWASPKWTNSELVALIAAEYVHTLLRGSRLPATGASAFGPTALDVVNISRQLEMTRYTMRTEDALYYARVQGLPSTVVDLSNRRFTSARDVERAG